MEADPLEIEVLTIQTTFRSTKRNLSEKMKKKIQTIHPIQLRKTDVVVMNKICQYVLRFQQTTE